MNEKTLEKRTGLSRRQIIMLQKTVIKRKNKIVVGISYDYSIEEVEEFVLAKMFKDCGYTYSEINKLMAEYNKGNKIEVVDKAITNLEAKAKELNLKLNNIY
ncbi:MAG: hypothetical protein L6U99_03200 [Clostridium sp.]|nr:MAG: hypothetical protein L6U99_03200 [Clostridium sp.]